MATESVLINIKIEGTENEAKINSFSQSIIKLQEENRKLAETNKALAKAEGDNTEAIAKNTSQIELNKQKIGEDNASRKGLIQTIVAEDNSIKALSVRNANLIKERNLINTSTEEGRKKIAAINSQLDENNKVIKDNSDALGKQKINIGNYASALDGIVPGLGGMVSGIQAGTKAAIAFIATPLGAVLAALGLALAAVTKYFTSSEEGADKFAKITAQASAIIDVLLDRVIMLGGALVAFATGDFSGGVQKLTSSFDGLGDEIEREVKLAGELTEALDTLEERELQYGLTVSETGNKIKNLIIQSKNRSLTEAERINKLEEATKLEVDLTDQALKIEEERLRIANEKILADFSQFAITRKRGESEIEFARRITKEEGILFSEREKLAEFIQKYDTIIDNSQNIQEKIQNQKDALTDRELANQEKRNSAAEKEVENILKIQEAEDKAYIAKVQREIDQEERNRKELEGIDERQKAQQDYANSIVAGIVIEKEATDELDEATLKSIDSGRKRISAGKQITDVNKENVKSAIALSAAVIGLAESESKAGKALALSTIAINSAIGVSNAVKAGSGLVWPLNLAAILSGITAVLAGITQAKGFLGKAAGGGDFITTGPQLLLVGDNPGGRERVTVQPLSGKGQTVMGNNMIALAGGGTVMANGAVVGNEIREASRGAFSQRPMVQTVLVLQDFEATQLSRDQDINMAKVV